MIKKILTMSLFLSLSFCVWAMEPSMNLGIHDGHFMHEASLDLLLLCSCCYDPKVELTRDELIVWKQEPRVASEFADFFGARSIIEQKHLLYDLLFYFQLSLLYNFFGTSKPAFRNLHDVVKTVLGVNVPVLRDWLIERRESLSESERLCLMDLQYLYNICDMRYLERMSIGDRLPAGEVDIAKQRAREAIGNYARVTGVSMEEAMRQFAGTYAT